MSLLTNVYSIYIYITNVFGRLRLMSAIYTRFANVLLNSSNVSAFQLSCFGLLRSAEESRHQWHQWPGEGSWLWRMRGPVTVDPFPPKRIPPQKKSRPGGLYIVIICNSFVI